ncbi:MAG TPA: hypothetical protein PK794_05985 [Armatimonadota bacterium]|nr:hypothetical protein [Armatimonadota bacterium]
MTRYACLCLLLFPALLALAAPEHGWPAIPLARWTPMRTMDSGAEAMTPAGADAPRPAPTLPYGTWTERDGVLAAVGQAACWSTMLMPGARRNVAVTTRFIVRESSGAARQLPGGCVRWGFHWGENLPGWDVGVVLGYQDPLHFYRVQVSASRGELALWDATGGFLQLIPCTVSLNTPHELTVRWRGAHLTAVLDGKTVMDYWDRSAPYAHGQVGLAVWRSTVDFTRVAIAGLPRRAERMPAHTPDFHFEPADHLLQGNAAFTMAPYRGVVLFDGREPISYFFKLALPADDHYSTDALMHEAVKLKPGWRPAYYTFIGPNGLKGSWRWPVLVGDLPEAFHVEKSGTELVFTFQTETPGTGRTQYRCTVAFDRQRGVYRYVYDGTLTLTAAAQVNEFELCDPLTYNNRMPGPEVVNRWNPSGHRWWLYQGAGGQWERMPLTDYPNDYSTEINNAVASWGTVTDFLYPDPAACPVFIHELKWPAGRFSPGQCAWGYDFHHRELNVGTLPAGTVRAFVMTFTAMPPAEAEAIVKHSRLMPVLEKETRPILPFDPRGTTFADVTRWQDPSCTMAWIGGTRDETTGHGDTASLRIDGPGKASVRIYHYMVEQQAKRWWVRGWIKTQDVAEPGVHLRLGYFDPPPVVQHTVNLGAGTRDWTYFSVITDVFGYRDVTDLIIETTGKGRAWIDDIAVSALADGQHPPTTATAPEAMGGGQ